MQTIGRKMWNRVTKKDWPGWARRKCLSAQITLLFVYIFMFLLPSVFLWTTEIPPMSQLQVSQGDLLHEEEQSKDGLLGLSEEGKIRNDYSCQTIFYENHDCHPKSKIENLAGQQATVWWFERKVYPWGRQRHLVRLVVDGQEEVAYEETLERIASEKRFRRYFSAGFLMFFLLCIWVVDFATSAEVAYKKS